MSEQELLARIAGGEAGARLVYADWLDQDGQSAKAGFVRAEHQLHAASERMVELRPGLDPDWVRSIERSDSWTLLSVVHTGHPGEEAYFLVSDQDLWPALRQRLLSEGNRLERVRADALLLLALEPHLEYVEPAAREWLQILGDTPEDELALAGALRFVPLPDDPATVHRRVSAVRRLDNNQLLADVEDVQGRPANKRAAALRGTYRD